MAEFSALGPLENFEGGEDAEALYFAYLMQGQQQTKRIDIFQLAIGALVLLSVVAWVEYIFFDLRGEAPVDPDNPNFNQRAQNADNVATTQEARRATQRRNRLIYAALITIITVVLVLFYNWYHSNSAKCPK